jgi:hypothetical protein
MKRVAATMVGRASLRRSRDTDLLDQLVSPPYTPIIPSVSQGDHSFYLQVMQPVLDLGTLVLVLLVASTFRAKFIDIRESTITITVPGSKGLSPVVALNRSITVN